MSPSRLSWQWPLARLVLWFRPMPLPPQPASRPAQPSQPFGPLPGRVRHAAVALALAAASLGSAWAQAPAGAYPAAEAERLDTRAEARPDNRTDTNPSGSYGQQLFNQVRDRSSELVSHAMTLLGVPYKRGGTDEATGLDCSAFVRKVFDQTIGLVLPRRSADQSKVGTPVEKTELKPGDLVFFNTLRRSFSHVGIYIGDSKFVHSPRAGGAVRVEDMRVAYWQKRYNGARRVAGDDTAPPQGQR